MYQLLEEGGVSEIDGDVLRRATNHFSPQLNLAVSQQSAVWAADAYRAAEELPSTTTKAQFLHDELILNGSLLGRGHNLLICFKKTVPKVLKIVKGREQRRLEENKERLRHPHIIPYEFIGTNYIIMPLLPTTLEHLARLLPGSELLLWQSMEPALTFLHSQQLAHMDVKPSNIFISCEGSFVLGDLGSVATFGCRTDSTSLYIPKDLQSKEDYKASKKVDWWMLAMTLAEKVIELPVKSEHAAPTQDALREKLAQDERMDQVWPLLLTMLELD